MQNDILVEHIHLSLSLLNEDQEKNEKKHTNSHRPSGGGGAPTIQF